MKQQAAKPVVTDPLAAVPMIAPGVEARADEKGVVQLRQKRTLGGGAVGRLCSKLGLSPDRQIHLDERASRFWSLIDGRRDLHEVASHVRREFSVEEDAARTLTVQFTRDLMLRELIVLRVDSNPAAQTGATG